MTFKLTLGDWSGDGHNITRSFFFNTNKTVAELEQIYEDNSAELGFDIFDYCSDYDDTKIPREDFNKLSGILDISVYLEKEDDEQIYVGCDEYKDIFVAIMNYKERILNGDADVQESYKLCGGYGLLSD